MTTDCGHRLCELIDRACSLATGRSRGCRPNLASTGVARDDRHLLAYVRVEEPELGDALARLCLRRR